MWELLLDLRDWWAWFALLCLAKDECEQVVECDAACEADSAEGFMQSGVAMVAEDMASRYAVQPTRVAGGDIIMSVTGVNSYADYAGVVSWLEGLELIDHANIERISADQIQLRLVAQAGSSQLASIIELNQSLVPLPVPQREGELAYRWQK